MPFPYRSISELDAYFADPFREVFRYVRGLAVL